MLIFTICLVGNILALETLFVFEMIRHGARSIDSHLHKTIPDGFFGANVKIGELTDTGRIQHMSIGHQRRNEYIKEKRLLSEVYNPREILSMSTFKQRCLESGRYFMHGLYPLQDIQFRQEVYH